MEKLNEYLQQLLSSCSDELRLEPEKNPYLVAQGGTRDVGNVPMLGTQISTLVFPLIPPHVKTTLPNSPEVEFVHSHALGNFNFNVQKSPAGFIVTIRPVLSDSTRSMTPPAPLPEAPPPFTPAPETFSFSNAAVETVPQYTPEPAPYTSAPPAAYGSDSASFTPEPAQPYASDAAPAFSYEFESSSAGYEATTSAATPVQTVADLLVDDRSAAAAEYVPTSGPEIDVVPVNDPAFQTVFSDSSAYEPPIKKSEFVETFSQPPPPPPEYVDLNQDMYDPTPSFDSAAPAAVEAPTPAVPPAQTFKPVPTVESDFVAAVKDPVQNARMDELFRAMAEMGASDLHLSVSMPPMVRRDGKMKPMRDSDTALTAEAMRSLLTSIMPSKNQEEFAQRHDTDFAYEIPELARFRCNIFMDRKGMGGVFRIIPTKILTAEQLGLSKAVMDLTGLSKGLVVVTGPTGSGKSTTLCAMVDSINKNREDHIITIEDPIEFTHENQKCLVNQREVHNHTDSFKDALRAALREDPDILLVGEMRDLETISIAIETAETGHLVFGTLHTTTAASTVDRIIDQFPADRQQQIRVMLSESLKGVIAQTLLPKKGGGRVAALEILIVTPAISNLIREGKTFQIPSAMQTGKAHGMVMLNEALFAHVESGAVEARDAYMKAVDKTSFETMLTRAGIKL